MANEQRKKKKIKAAFRKETLRECRIIIIIIILKWLLHFSLFLQTGAEFLWLPVGARVSLEQLHTMVTPDLVGKKSTGRNVSVIQNTQFVQEENNTEEQKDGNEVEGYRSYGAFNLVRKSEFLSIVS